MRDPESKGYTDYGPDIRVGETEPKDVRESRVDGTPPVERRHGPTPTQSQETTPDVSTFPPPAPEIVVGSDDHHPVSLVLVAPDTPTPRSLPPTVRPSESDVGSPVGPPS